MVWARANRNQMQSRLWRPPVSAGSPISGREVIFLLSMTALFFAVARLAGNNLASYVFSQGAEASRFALSKILQGIVFIPVVSLLLHRNRLVEFRDNPAKAETLAFLLAFLCLWFVNLIPSLLATMLDAPDAFSVSTAQSRVSFAANPALLIVGYGILGPILEEMLCRGVLFRVLRLYAGFLLSAIASSLVFALFHGVGLITIITFLGGVLFCYLYERTRNFAIPVGLHMLNNLLAILFHSESVNSVAGSTEMGMIITLVICTGVLLLALFLIHRLTEKV